MTDAGAVAAAPLRRDATDGGWLELRGIAKSFGAVVALSGVDLAIAAGEMVALLGGSGCGKSTLLRVIAGFTRPDAGRVVRGGTDITAMEPAQRRIGFVFQSYALFPTMSVAQNIGFALKVGGADRTAIDARVREMARLVEIDELLARFPHELSGGQQQRVALARALAPAPDLLLLDEPLSALDARIRIRLREDIRAVIRRVGATAIYVTHDQEEALAIADRVAIMDRGRLEQIDTPAALYDRPATRFVAGFLGTTSFIRAVAESPRRARVGRRVVDLAAACAVAPGQDCVLAVRPELVGIDAAAIGEADGMIVASSFLGAVRRCRIRMECGELLADVANDGSGACSLPEGTAVGLRFAANRLLAFPLDDAATR